MSFRWPYRIGLFSFIVITFLAGCTLGQKSPESQGASATLTVEEPTFPVVTWAPTPTATPIPRALTICLGAEPDTLYLYGGASLAQSQVLAAVYDGPIDTRGFDFQPVILEKLPDLANGDAVIEPVSVKPGDWAVNDVGELVQLKVGEMVRPYGCTGPECAVAWDGSALEMAQLSATFKLLDSLQWSDGAPLTAADSVFSYEVAKECQSEIGPCGGLGLVTQRGSNTVERTASYTALDERRVRWVGMPGYLDPDYRVNFFIPLPKHRLGQLSQQDLFDAPEAARQPLGWGPYVIEQWVPGERIVLKRNPYYLQAGEGWPAFTDLIYRFVGQDADQNLADLESGACDLLDQEASLAFQDSAQDGGIEILQAEEAAGKLRAYFATGTLWEHADFGIRSASYDDGYQLGLDRPDFFGDTRTRRAIALCMDRQRIADEVLHGLSQIPDSYLPSGHPLFDPEVAKYPFDPAAGSALLEEVGWVDGDGNPETPRLAAGVPNVIDGTPLQFTYLTSNALQRQQVGAILAESLAQCGVQVEVQFGEVGQLFAPGPAGPIFGRQFDLAQFTWLTGVRPPCDLWLSDQIPGDPSLSDENGNPLFPLGWGGQNETGYSSAEFDQVCQAALQALPGQPGYTENHMQAQEIFAADLPVVPLYLRLKVAVTRPDLCGFELDPTTISELWNIEKLDYGEGCEE